MRADPGGSIPHWPVNWASEQLPFHTIEHLREQVKVPGYQKHAETLEATLDWAGSS